MAQTETSQRYKLEYEAFTKRSKWYGNKNLYYKWRRGNIDDKEAADLLGVNVEAVYNDRRNFPDRFNFSDNELKEVQKKHVTQVEQTNKTIKKAQELVGDAGSNGRDPRSYSLEDHITEIMHAINAEDSENLVELAVKVHRYIFLHEFSGYDKLRELALQSIDRIRLDAEDDGLYAAKTLNDMLDKKQASLEEKIKAIITEYGTLLHSAAADVMTDQEKQIEKLAGYVLELAPDRLGDIVDMVDESG